MEGDWLVGVPQRWWAKINSVGGYLLCCNLQCPLQEYFPVHYVLLTNLHQGQPTQELLGNWVVGLDLGGHPVGNLPLAAAGNDIGEFTITEKFLLSMILAVPSLLTDI